MTPDEHLDQHLELCKRIYERLLAEGSWPWPEVPDSQKSADLVESEDSKNNA